MKRRVKSPKAKLKSDLSDLVRQIVRDRDEMTCQWCERDVERKNAHVSHVLPKKIYPRLEFDLSNVKLLCLSCHLWVWHLDPLSGAEWFKKKFPARYRYLMKQREKGKPFKLAELQEIYDDLLEQV